MPALTIGFLGSGVMSSSIAEGVARTDLFARYLFTDPNPESVTRCCGLVPAPHTASGAEMADMCREADVIVLGIKPQVAPAVLPKVREVIEAASGNGKRKIVVSIMAGITIASLKQMLGEVPSIVRVMPNALLKVGGGASGVAPATDVSAEDAAIVQKLFESVGFAAVVPEGQLNAVTGVSGSGPAYIAVVIEALADGGVKAGLPRKLALELAIHTVAGTGEMCKRGGEGGAMLHPALLKDLVCSPGGTSIYGVTAAEKAGLRTSLVEAVMATKERAQQLGEAKL